MDPSRLTELPSYARRARAREAARERAADEMAGRTVWCVSGLLVAGAPAQRLHQTLSRLEAHGLATRERRLPDPRRQEDPFAQVERDGDALLGGSVAREDVVVLEDREMAPLARVARERGPHVVWLAASGEGRSSRAWQLPIDAVLFMASQVAGRSMPEQVTLAMPSPGVVAATEIGPGGEMSWLQILAGIVHDDREETVGGRRHARPAVAVR
jgi:hypothetical protein